MTITPALLTLLGLLVASLSALLAGGVAWGRFASALEQLRSDHRDLRDDVRKGALDGAELAAHRQRLADHDAEIRSMRERLHKAESAATRLEAELSAVRRTAERAEDAQRQTHHPHT